MKTLLASLALLAASMTVAFAGEASGSITAVDAGTMTMTLDDGQTYKLPEGFDVSLIGEGMTIALAFDEANGEKLITDMEQID